MNKEHFLTELKIHLKPLPKQQIDYILQLYAEKFDTGLAEGKQEAMISKALGSPRTIAEEFLTELDIEAHQPEEPHDEWQEFTAPGYHPYRDNGDDAHYSQKQPSFFVRFCQVTGVLMFNAFFMIWMIFAALALVFAFWLVTLVLLLAPILGVIAFFMTAGAPALFQLFVSIFLSGLGFIGLAIMIPITTYTFRFLKYYTVWTINTLRGRR